MALVSVVPRVLQPPRRLGDGRVQLTFRDDGGSGVPDDLSKLILISTDEFRGTNTVWTTNTTGFTTNNGYLLIKTPAPPTPSSASTASLSGESGWGQ